MLVEMKVAETGYVSRKFIGDKHTSWFRSYLKSIRQKPCNAQITIKIRYYLIYWALLIAIVISSPYAILYYSGRPPPPSPKILIRIFHASLSCNRRPQISYAAKSILIFAISSGWNELDFDIRRVAASIKCIHLAQEMSSCSPRRCDKEMKFSI